ncbi:branched-chain amino acid transport [Pseudodesulfovibrio mercurii]|uniref:Branched-chain amino acid transport n=1 Tax=Pseudodesulfovibrio mercurii TaxID=641491 RepID=F0JFB6_9BACT|nr:AzlD domain-containing protein [Pseudodesulfovibrio mercurii]EGB13672.1 branched-chain amino acid transport [Pseudodesulfovibrio mercurii]
MGTDSLIAILGMAAVTYLTRIAGPWLVRLVQGNQRVEACLSRLPGSILAALLAPLVFAVGTAEAVASGVTLVFALRFRNMPLSLVAGVGSLILLRHLL